jgi:hypothetical protein
MILLLSLNFKQDIQIYNDPNWQPGPSNSYYVYQVGSYVYAVQSGTNYNSKGQITAIVDNTYTVNFIKTGITQSGYTYDQLIPYYNCDCSTEITKSYGTGYSQLESNFLCYLPESLVLGTAVL